ncbi:MAG TPA: hypothetical protein ENG87_02235 [Candidatus Pacearchaeota archaeon]|nr:hypothetical protein BMS3Abin17_01220 [archaeon BMS3Abin17]HDK42173.1 hypothetical protein [Candidatus Pacearchaeota archaeon]HDZ61149.1 hypothetical protein [Candidatus Pacearchaeota archaeon]
MKQIKKGVKINNPEIFLIIILILSGGAIVSFFLGYFPFDISQSTLATAIIAAFLICGIIYMFLRNKR